uniref:Nop domain-containing protein n=2 Tax=Timema TaxID=61471 RepID=A0A7R9F7J6_9NEOP|nr:unnamed protein product [Timema bartmani]
MDTTEALAATTAAVEGKLSKGLKKTLKKLIGKDLQDQLLVADAKLGNAIKDKLNLSCLSNTSVQELMRCIRSQMDGLLAGLPKKEMAAMALGLAHSLSRYKLKFSPDKIDTMIVQAVCLLDDLDKELNNYIMRCREWYGWHFPELGKIITDNIAFVKTIKTIGTRENTSSTDLSDILPEEVELKLREAAEISMGTEILEDDILNIRHLCDQVIDISAYRAQLYDYLKARMMAIAPNLTVLVGDLVGARLISHAASELLSEGCKLGSNNPYRITWASGGGGSCKSKPVLLGLQRHQPVGRRERPITETTMLKPVQCFSVLLSGRVISLRSLINLAKHPASTLQILGAEKALFRALKTKRDTPKYGLIYHSQIVGMSSTKNKGKFTAPTTRWLFACCRNTYFLTVDLYDISYVMLAAKASLATRVDALGEDSTSIELGAEHKVKVENRLRLLEEGNLRSISGTGKAKARFEKYHSTSEVRQYSAADDSTLPSSKRKFSDSFPDTPTKVLIEEIGSTETQDNAESKKKKKKKKLLVEVKVEDDEEQNTTLAADSDISSKKKKKKPKEESNISLEVDNIKVEGGKKKKKRKHDDSQEAFGDGSFGISGLFEEAGEGKKKRKKIKLESTEESVGDHSFSIIDMSASTSTGDIEIKKEKKKRKSALVEEVDQSLVVATPSKKDKKKKKSLDQSQGEASHEEYQEVAGSSSEKKKKKKKSKTSE